MCLLLLAVQAHPEYKLVIAANRDEFYERPTAPAGFWDDRPDVLAGRDLRAGGTWLGITRSGRIAALTNYRDPASIKPHAPSRGELVSDFLKGKDSPDAYLTTLAQDGDRFNGFNLIAGVKDCLYCYSNREDRILQVPPGIHGLSNHLLDTPWPKVSRATSALSEVLTETIPSTERFFELLADRAIAQDHRLPDTGVGIEWERILSPIFISSPAYGTRCSTVLLIRQDRHATFIERTYQPASNRHTDRAFEFIIED